MADITFGVVGIASLAVQVATILDRFSTDWHNCLKEADDFRKELSLLNTTLARSKHVIDRRPEYHKAFDGLPAALISTTVIGDDVAKQCIDTCGNELRRLHDQLLIPTGTPVHKCW